jgi:hypothetical protein
MFTRTKKKKKKKKKKTNPTLPPRAPESRRPELHKSSVSGGTINIPVFIQTKKEKKKKLIQFYFFGFDL